MDIRTDIFNNIKKFVTDIDAAEQLSSLRLTTAAATTTTTEPLAPSLSAFNITRNFRIFNGSRGLQVHQQKSTKRTGKRVAKKGCKCRKKEVWIVPSRESERPWEGEYITKEIFANCLGLELTGDIIRDDLTLCNYQEFENDDVTTQAKDNEVGEGNESDGCEKSNLFLKTVVDEPIDNCSSNQNVLNSYQDQEYMNNSGHDRGLAECSADNSIINYDDGTSLEGSNDIQCQECGKNFKEKRRLVDHITDVHSGRKTCELCPQTFSNTRNLNRHIRDIHERKESNIICSNCGKSLSRSDNIKKT